MGNTRKTIAYFKDQVSELTSVLPASASDGFCSIEKPDITTGQRETINSELLSANIGLRKPQLGFETASASFNVELRSHGGSSGVPTPPDFNTLLKSAIGSYNISTQAAVQASPAPSTTEFRIATEGQIKKFDMLLIDNATDGKVVRFCKSLKLAVVTGVNDKIDFTEGGPDLLATLAAGTYTHGSSSVGGSIGEQIKTALEAAGAANYTVTAVEQEDGSYIYTIVSDGATFELLLATGSNVSTAFLKLNLGFGSLDLTGAITYTAGTAAWGNKVVVNQAFTNAPTAGDIVYPSVNYKPIQEGHSHFTSGFYNGNSDTDGYLEKVVGCLVSSLGYTINTGAIAKMAFEVMGLKGERTALTKSPYSPTYEDVQGLVGFCVEVWINNNIVGANALSINLANDVVEKRSFKSCSGKLGSIVRGRTVTGSINPYADGSIDYFNALNDLTDYEMMVVIGKKDADGFMIGQTVGIYLPQVMFTKDKTGDIDDNMIEDIEFSAHSGADGSKLEIVSSFA